MKVLGVAIPAAGHVNPLLPLVRALVAQGHQVAFACGEDPGGAIASSGAEHLPVGDKESPWFDTLRSRVRGFPGDGLAPERINHYFVPRLFADIGAGDMIDQLIEAGRKFDPDLIVHETFAFAAPLAAEELGVPAVHHLIAPMLPHEVMDLANDSLCPLWRSFDRSAPGWGGVFSGLTIEVAPPSLEPLSIPDGESIRLRPAPLPVRPPDESDRILVYVTLGTFFGGNTDVFRSVLDGLAGEDLDVLVTVGADNDPGELGSPPDNVRVERYIPQADLLPGCAVVVHHGGSGTMFGAIAHGLPQVVIPQGADNFVNAEHIESSGIGLSILPADLGPAEVRRRVRGVLDNPSFAAKAAQVAREVAAMPGADDVARELTNRFGRRRP